MNFAINIEYGNYNNKNRVLAFEEMYSYFRNRDKKELCKFHVNAIILTPNDFEINSNDIQIVSDSSSIQYRPKGLHRNSKGVFYKINGSPIYLDQKEIYELEHFIDECIKNKEKLCSR